MTIRYILPALAILVSFSSCSQKAFLLPANTGGYGSVGKPEKTAVILPEGNLEASVAEDIPSAASEENQAAITYPAARYQERKPSILSVKPIPAQENLAFKQPEKPVKNQKRSSLNDLIASVQKKNKEDNPEKPEGEFKSNLFSILSLASGLAGILLAVLFGSGIFYLLGLPAIIFGIIGLARKEKLKALAIAGLIIGLLEVAVIIAGILFLLNY